MKCTKVCEYDAIHVTNFLAKIDNDKCVGCGVCADNCPVGCITIFDREKASEINFYKIKS
jgi:Fe-S-cluster-containing hydrogenase component 2